MFYRKSGLRFQKICTKKITRVCLQVAANRFSDFLELALIVPKSANRVLSHVGKEFEADDAKISRVGGLL
jgi:hypothetical protein